MPSPEEKDLNGQLEKLLPVIQNLLNSGKIEDAFDLLTAPLHSELHIKQDFKWTETLAPLSRVALYFDYVRTQVLQGGFVQLISNHYISLLLPLPDWFVANGQAEMAATLDDVLRVYVLNHEHLKEETTVEEFAKRYEQFPEFSQLDSRFEAAYPDALAVIVMHMVEGLRK